ncbi:MAG: S-methyl-5-thioribose-1-phosphate isomerase [Planctomycetes bacterium]|nr:S-methyl-5-thioribose-1-phosphate isomerase [Planctomycetota bacterium]MBI3847533.1 S-methyl-5-thioribose-1-phosphate isomerase [Planctomycetota bacterium]
MPVPTITWEGGEEGSAHLIDQTLLPESYRIVECRTAAAMWDAIKRLAVRGAPAIGVAAAFGAYLGIQHSSAATGADLEAELLRTCDTLATARPTAVNLFWALNRMKRAAASGRHLDAPSLRRRLFEEASRILDEDRAICRKLGEVGRGLVRDSGSYVTHCNAGGLATADYGTALAVFYAAKDEGKRFTVYADETRPLLQGARLTAWELHESGVPVTVIADGMAASLMKSRKIDAVFVGADRIARNGDTANKIGTYSLALVARAHAVPFYVVAPISTFDLTLAHGGLIPIEERDASEVTQMAGKRVVPEGVPVWNPAFDVTPAALIAGIVTECGLIEAPSAERIAAVFTTGRATN